MSRHKIVNFICFKIYVIVYSINFFGLHFNTQEYVLHATHVYAPLNANGQNMNYISVRYSVSFVFGRSTNSGANN